MMQAVKDTNMEMGRSPQGALASGSERPELGVLCALVRITSSLGHL